MKSLITLLIALSVCIASYAADSGNGKGDGKSALLMVHFGTTFDDTRSRTIDAINRKASEAFPEMDVFEAYTSRMIIRKLAKNGIEKHTPGEMLLKLAAEGYTHVFIQSTNIIEGIEMQTLRSEAEMMAPFFNDVRVGDPLLYSLDDCRRVVRILAERHSDCVAAGKSAVVMVGHGTHTPATAIYSQIDYMFGAEGFPAFQVSTIEGYPTFDTTVNSLKKQGVESVTLIPFMFVAGDHARNDIDCEWRNNMAQEGFKVSVRMEGLGQIPGIQDIFIDHIRQGLASRPLTAVEHKAAFLKENLK